MKRMFRLSTMPLRPIALPIKNKDPDMAALEKLKNYNMKLEKEIKQTKQMIDPAIRSTSNEDLSTSTKLPSSSASDLVSISRAEDIRTLKSNKH